MPGADYDVAVNSTKSKLNDILQHKQMDNVQFDIAVEDELPFNATTGKFQMIVKL